MAGSKKAKVWFETPTYDADGKIVYVKSTAHGNKRGEKSNFTKAGMLQRACSKCSAVTPHRIAKPLFGNDPTWRCCICRPTRFLERMRNSFGLPQNWGGAR